MGAELDCCLGDDYYYAHSMSGERFKKKIREHEAMYEAKCKVLNNEKNKTIQSLQKEKNARQQLLMTCQKQAHQRAEMQRMVAQLIEENEHLKTELQKQPMSVASSLSAERASDSDFVHIN
eukprot:214771_1